MIDTDRAKEIAAAQDAFWRKEIALSFKLSRALTELVLSEDEEAFNRKFILFQEWCLIRQELEPWSNIKGDRYLELFELVETDEAKSRTTTETTEIPTETIPE